MGLSGIPIRCRLRERIVFLVRIKDVYIVGKVICREVRNLYVHVILIHRLADGRSSLVVVFYEKDGSVVERVSLLGVVKVAYLGLD